MVHTAQVNPAGNSDREMATVLPFFGSMTLDFQKELFQVYGRLGRIWLDRLQAETMLWAKLVGDLATSHSGAEVLEAYSGHMTRQAGNTAEDGRQAMRAYQEIAPQPSTLAIEDSLYDPGLESGLDFTLEPPVKH